MISKVFIDMKADILDFFVYIYNCLLIRSCREYSCAPAGYFNNMETKICPRCNNEFPKTPEFFYFYHKETWPADRFWIHTNCRECNRKIVLERNNKNYVHKLKLKSNVEIIKTREKAKRTTARCPVCDVEYPLELKHWYFNNKRKAFDTSKCKDCKADRAAERYYTVQGRIPEIDNVLPNPGEFHDEDEREEVQEFLTKLGWEYSDLTKQWFKSNLKSKHGHWKFQTYER